jgi:hypothetical protein
MDLAIFESHHLKERNLMWHKMNWLAVAWVVLACGVVAMFGGQAAQADTILSATYSVAPATVPFSDTITLPGAYDPIIGYVPADGTLAAVTLSLATTATAEVDVSNLSPSISYSFSGATAVVPVSLTGPSSLMVSDNTTAGPFNGTANPGLNPFTGIPGSGSNSQNDPDLAAYNTTSTISLTAASAGGTYGGFSDAPPNTVFFGGGASAGGTFEVTYDYSTAVPEPSTIALLGIGAVGLLGYFRRKRAA